MLNESNWIKREEGKHGTLMQVRDRDIKLGAHYLYRGRSAITPGLTYDAKVIKLTPWLVIVDLTAIQEDGGLGDAIPYSFAILRIDIGRTERLYKRIEEASECEALC